MQVNDRTKIYWHHELPPLAADAIGEHTVEATSCHVPGTIAHRDELWTLCYEDLMAQARARLNEERIRLGGDYAHVLSESVDSKHDPVRGERGYTVFSLTCSIDRPKAKTQITVPKNRCGQGPTGPRDAPGGAPTPNRWRE